MKKINTNTQFKTLEGKTIVMSENNNQPLILKMVLLNVLGTYQAQSGEESIKIYDIGIRINQAKDFIELEDADFSLLEKVVNNNKIFVSVVTAQILKYFNKIKEDNKEGK